MENPGKYPEFGLNSSVVGTTEVRSTNDYQAPQFGAVQVIKCRTLWVYPTDRVREGGGEAH